MSMAQAKRGAKRARSVPNLPDDAVAVSHNTLDAIAAYEVDRHDAETAGNREAAEFVEARQAADRDDVGRMRALPGQHLHDRLAGGSGQRASAAVRATCDGRPPDGAAQEAGCTRRFDRHDGTCLADDSARNGVLR